MSAFETGFASTAWPALLARFGCTADYAPPTGSSQAAVVGADVVVGAPEMLAVESDGRVLMNDETRELVVASDVIATVEVGGRFTIGSLVYAIDSEDPPSLDGAGLWHCRVRRRIRQGQLEQRMR